MLWVGREEWMLSLGACCTMNCCRNGGGATPQLPPPRTHTLEKNSSQKWGLKAKDGGGKGLVSKSGVG